MRATLRAPLAAAARRPSRRALELAVECWRQQGHGLGELLREARSPALCGRLLVAVGLPSRPFLHRARGVEGPGARLRFHLERPMRAALRRLARRGRPRPG